MSDPAEVPSVVFDCNVLIQAALHQRGPAASCLTAVEAGTLRLYVSAEVLTELRTVLLRPRMRRKFPSFTRAKVDTFVQRVVDRSVTVSSVVPVFTLPRDPKDQVYINLAIQVAAKYLISRDQDLLYLSASNSDEAVALRQLAPDLEILDPVAFLTRLRPPADEVPPE